MDFLVLGLESEGSGGRFIVSFNTFHQPSKDPYSRRLFIAWSQRTTRSVSEETD